jgi:hypothetical protein
MLGCTHRPERELGDGQALKGIFDRRAAELDAGCSLDDRSGANSAVPAEGAQRPVSDSESGPFQPMNDDEDF